MTATAFYSQLRIFSERVFKSLGIMEKETPWTYGQFAPFQPIGAVLHFTAGNIPERAIRWFMLKKHAARASAHVVVLDDWPETWKQFANDLPMVKVLETAVVQCMPPTHTTWHATWTNRTHYGIEMVNAGEVRQDEDSSWVYWPNDWKEVWKSEKQPVKMNGKFWEPYTFNQVLTVVRILRYLRQFRAGEIIKHEIIGHENVAENKSDPGPLFPIHDVRLAVYEDIEPNLYQWFTHLFNDDRYMEFYRDGIALEWLRSSSAPVQSERTVAAIEAWGKLIQALRTKLQASGAGFGALGKAGLKVLGYHVSNVVDEDLTYSDKGSVKSFQRMMGLEIDGDPGPRTRAALLARIEMLGFADGVV